MGPPQQPAHRRRRRRPDGVVPQGPAARQHRSRGPPGRRRRHANPHPGRRPPQPNPHNVHDETRQTPGREPPTQPLREAQPGHVTHGHRPNSEHRPFSRRTSTVLTTNKYRSHGRAGRRPLPAPPCPYRERPRPVRLQASSEPPSAGSPSQDRPRAWTARARSTTGEFPVPGLPSSRSRESADRLDGAPRDAGPGPAPSPPRPDRRAVSITAWSSSGPPPPRPGAPTASHPCQAGGRRPPPHPDRPCPGRPRPRQASRSRPRSRRRPDPAPSPPP